MAFDDLEASTVQHVSRYFEGEEPVHILCADPYECRAVLTIIEYHFPDLTVGGPSGEPFHHRAGKSHELAQTFLPVMLGSLSGMCCHYQCARLHLPNEAFRFRSAVALVINYDAQQEGSCLCCVGESFIKAVSTLHVRDFLSVYREVTHLHVDFPKPDPRPYWDYGEDRPIY